MSAVTIPYQTNKRKFHAKNIWQKPTQTRTLSFTTLIALARDNNYQIVIVLAEVFQPIWLTNHIETNIDTLLKPYVTNEI